MALFPRVLGQLSPSEVSLSHCALHDANHEDGLKILLLLSSDTTLLKHDDHSQLKRIAAFGQAVDSYYPDHWWIRMRSAFISTAIHLSNPHD